MARGKRVMIGLDVFTYKRPGPDGTRIALATRVITRMFPDAVEALGITDMIEENNSGKLITAPNGNGEYRYLVKGCEGQQEITLISSQLTDKNANRTFRFRVPYWYPNYRISLVVRDWNNIIGFKRNGAVYAFPE